MFTENKSITQMLEEMKQLSEKPVVFREMEDNGHNLSEAHVAKLTEPDNIVYYVKEEFNLHLCAHELAHLILCHKVPREKLLAICISESNVGEMRQQIKKEVVESRFKDKRYTITGTKDSIYDTMLDWCRFISTSIFWLGYDLSAERYIAENYPELKQLQIETHLGLADGLADDIQHSERSSYPREILKRNYILRYVRIRVTGEYLGYNCTKKLNTMPYLNTAKEISSFVKDYLTGPLERSFDLHLELAKKIDCVNWYSTVKYDDSPVRDRPDYVNSKND